jgi:hypothetical protein
MYRVKSLHCKQFKPTFAQREVGVGEVKPVSRGDCD